MCGSAVVPNDSFSAPCLMIPTSRCGNAAAMLITSLTPFPPHYFQANQSPGSKLGLGRLGWQQGSVFTTLGKRQSPGGIQVSHSLAHASASHGFPTSSKRENSLLWTQLRDCKGRMQCPAVIKNAFLLVVWLEPKDPCSDAEGGRSSN